MVEWQYYEEEEDDPERPSPFRSLMRLRIGDPLMAGEVLYPGEARWAASDELYRQAMLGSYSEYLKISAEKAEAALKAWVDSGHMSHIPEETGPDQPERPDEETIGAWAALEARARAASAAVPVPPGAADIGRETSGVDR